MTNEAIYIVAIPFDAGDSIDGKAKKVLEEAAEIRGELQHGTDASALLEVADTITAAINLAVALGYDEGDIRRAMSTVMVGNVMRGRYDDGFERQSK